MTNLKVKGLLIINQKTFLNVCMLKLASHQVKQVI